MAPRLEAAVPGMGLPDVYLLPDGEGRLQKVLGIPYEEFVEAQKFRAKASGGPAPRFTIERVRALGADNGRFAKIRLEIEVALTRGPAVRIPLGIANGILLEPIVHVGGEDPLPVEVDEGGGGHFVWLAADEDTQVELVLHVLVPLTREGPKTILRTNMPRAETAFLTLVVGAEEANVEASEQTARLALRAVPQGTELSLAGAVGSIEVAWEPRSPATQDTTAMEVSGLVLARLDGHALTSEARLVVRSLGGRLHRFRIRLPVGAELVSISNPAYVLLPESNAAAESRQGRPARVIEIQPASDSPGTAELQLVTRSPIDPDRPDQVLDLSGFDVLGAVRQFGQIGVEVTGDWHVQWTERDGVARTERPFAVPAGSGRTVGFEYYRQPYRLTGRLSVQESQLRVEPTMEVVVGVDRARLDATWRYSIRTRSVFALDLNLAGWQLDVDRIRPVETFDVDAIVQSGDGPVTLPLRQPAQGELELKFSAYRPLDTGSSNVAFPLPSPSGGSMSPASVHVSSETNVELLPVLDRLAGLTPQPLPADPQSARSATYHYLAEVDRARFFAERTVHRRLTKCEIAATVRVDREKAELEQAIAYRVDYEPLDQVLLDLPGEPYRNEQLQVTLEGRPLKMTPVTEATGSTEQDDVHHAIGDAQPALTAAATLNGEASPGEASSAAAMATGSDESDVDPGTAVKQQHSAARIPMRITLPQPRIGAFTLVVRQPIEVPEMGADREMLLRVPLAVPLDSVTAAQLQVVTPSNLRVASGPPHPWRVGEPVAAASHGTPQSTDSALWVSDRVTPTADLALGSPAPVSQGGTVIDRLWLQTWLTGMLRHDRAVFRLRTPQGRLTVRLPTGASPTDVRAVVDGASAAHRTLAGNRVDIDIARASVDGWHHIEIESNAPLEGLPGLIDELEPVRLDEDNPGIRQTYWDVYLPSRRYLIGHGSGYHEESTWVWHAFGLARQPVLSASELATWSGGGGGWEASSSRNHYQFSCFGDLPPLRVYTVRRFALVLVAAGLALGVGLLWIHFPALRRPGILYAGVILLMSAAFAFPGPVILAAQASVVGGVLAVMAALLERRRMWRETLSQTGSFVQLPSTETQAFVQPAVAAGSSATTKIAASGALHD